MDDIVNLISNIGFPIAMVLWFLKVGEKKLDELTGSMNRLTNSIERMVEANGTDHRDFRAAITKCPGPYEIGDQNGK